MFPRYLARMQRQEGMYRSVYGEPLSTPPPSPSFSSTGAPSIKSASSSSQSRRSGPGSPTSAYHHYSPNQYQHAEAPPLPKGSLVLVIGASTFLGTHIVDQLLDHGYRVRGVVPNADQAFWSSKYFVNKYGSAHYTTAIFPTLVPQNALDLAIRGCAGVIHLPAEPDFSADPYEAIPPTIACALNVLEAAAREPQVCRFVHSSSNVAAVDVGSGARNEATSKSWNVAAFTAAWAAQMPRGDKRRAWAAYASGMMQTEQVVWKWHRDRKPAFVLNCVLPSMLWGRSLNPKPPELSWSLRALKHVFDSSSEATPWRFPQHVSDVQDAALLHVGALALPDITNKRLFAATAPTDLFTILDVLRNFFPLRTFPGSGVAQRQDRTVYPELWRSEEVLRRMGRKGWRDLEETILCGCECFL